MKISRKQNAVISVVFFLTLLLPGIYTIATNMQDSIYKNIAYMKDNFGGKDYLLEKYIKFKYYTLHESPQPDKVIIGKNGWFFLGDFFEKGHSVSLGLTKFSKSELEKIAGIIQERKNFLDVHNIKFYIAIAPNKQSVYDKYLLEGRYNPDNSIQVLKRYLKDKINFNLIDLKEAIDPFKDSLQLYYKTDTHWNGIGAFLAFNKISAIIKNDYPLFTPYTFNDYIVKRTKLEGHDLSEMLKMKIDEDEITLEPKFSKTGIAQVSKLKIPFNFGMEKKSYEKRFINAKKKYKILVFRDSFTTAMVPYFKENFGSSLLVWDFNFNKQLILEEKPDIVLYIIAERLVNIAFLK